MSEFVRPLTMSSDDGRPYTRLREVEGQIAETLNWSEADVLAKRKSLLNEVLLYNIRRFRQRDEEVHGLLLLELGKRTLRVVGMVTRDLDQLAKEDIAMQVEVEVLNLAIAPQPSRESEFLEIAFNQTVKRRAIKLRQQYTRTVQGNRGRYKPILDVDEQEKKMKRPLEHFPDSRDGPEGVLLAFQDEQFREEAYRIVQAALDKEDERLLLAFRLHVVDGWPLWCENPLTPSVARTFSLKKGQAKYLLEKTRKIIAEVLSAYKADRKMAATGVRK